MKMCVYGGSTVPQPGLGDRHLATVPQGGAGDRLPWVGQERGGGGHGRKSWQDPAGPQETLS